MKSGSIYIADFGDSVKEADLEILIGKLLSVKNVYIPGQTPTGLQRRFAILRVEGEDDKSIADCARKLNNCQWKGCRLRVELARPFFADRLAEERLAQQAETKQHIESAAVETVLPEFNPVEKGGVLCIRRIYGHHEWVASVSNGARVIKRGMAELKVLQLGTRLKFDYDLDDCLISNHKNNHEKNIPICTEIDVRNIVEDDVNEVANNKSDIDTLQRNSGSRANAGRRGFGTLLENGTSLDSNQCKSYPDNKLFHEYDVDNHNDEGHTFRKPSVHDEFASGHMDSVDDAGTGRGVAKSSKEYNYDDDSDEDVHIPACGPEDLEPDALANERKRALSLFAEAANDAGQSFEPTDRPVHARLNKRGWEAVRETASLRYDPTADDRGASLEMDKDEKIALVEKVRQRNQELEDRRTENFFSTSSSADAALSAEKPHADLGELKDIFSRNAGVWFGDDGGLKETVQREGKGPALDDIFLAAERQGHDIRANDSSVNKLTFGFFDETDMSAEHASEIKHSGINDPYPNLVSCEESSNDNSDPDSDEDNNMARCSISDMETMFVHARKFCRASILTVEDLQQAWRFAREKGALDYKRRVHDLKRRNKKFGLVSSQQRPSASFSVDHFKRDNSQANSSVTPASFGKQGGGGFRKRGGRRGQGGKK